MKKTITSISLCLISLFAFAQKDTSYWATGGTINLSGTLSQYNNWIAGGTDNVTVNGLSSLFAKYAKGKTTWDNKLDLAYGSIKTGNFKDKSLKQWAKADDRLEFESKFGHLAINKWYYSVLLNARTQFDAGFDGNTGALTSKFMAPGYVTLAIGMDYKPNKQFYAFVSPLTARITIVNDQDLANAGAYGVDKATYDNLGNILTLGKTRRNELGAYVKSGITGIEVVKNVFISSDIALFANYLQKHPENVDVYWNFLLTMKVNSNISATFTTNWIYDDDIAINKLNYEVLNAGKPTVSVGPGLQIKNVLGVGFTYKIGAAKKK